MNLEKTARIVHWIRFLLLYAVGCGFIIGGVFLMTSNDPFGLFLFGLGAAINLINPRLS